MNFKHGDKVTCYIDGEYIDDARISINENGIPYICQNFKDGAGTKDRLEYKYSWCLNGDFSSKLNLSGTIQVTDLKLADTRTEITWDNLQEGDVVIENGNEIEVLGICGKVVFLRGYALWLIKENLIKNGYTIKQPTPSQPIPDETQKAIEHLQANGYKVTKE